MVEELGLADNERESIAWVLVVRESFSSLGSATPMVSYLKVVQLRVAAFSRKAPYIRRCVVQGL